jgi:sulfur-oxidizing protein SoxX
MFKKTSIAAAIAAASTMILVASGCASTNGESAQAAAPAEPAEMMVVDSKGVRMVKLDAKQLAEHLILESNSFRMDQPVQEGGTAGARLVQDELQKICSSFRDQPVDAETAAKINAMARETIKYPEGGVKLGDWKKGRELAWSGFGWRVGHNNDDHSKQEPGANCYNCHQLATDRTGGTIGPSLTGYGKLRGTSEPVLKFAYEMIYNPHTYFACTNMPRMGANGVMTQEQISHVLAYLFDPESPVNK